jgi:tryptophan synthase alpha chain
MKAINSVFSNLKAKGQTAFVPFSVAGFPDLPQSEHIFKTLSKGDILEFGYPFSDPVADGPVIQAAAKKSIENGMNMDLAFSMMSNIRKYSNIPIVFFSYFNPIHHYGIDRFISRAVEINIDGLLIVDLPLEETRWIKPKSDKAGIAWIYLITPTTPDERIREMDASGSGFLYYVSVLGVTGSRTNLPETLSTKCEHIRGMTKLPLVVGFGISTPDQAYMLKSHVDGVVSGSAIISRIADDPDSLDAWVENMKHSLR